MRTVGQLYYQETGLCSAQVNIPVSVIRCTIHVEANESNIINRWKFFIFCENYTYVLKETFIVLGIDLQCFMDISKHFKETDDVARRSKALYKTIKLYQNSLSSMERVNKEIFKSI